MTRDQLKILIATLGANYQNFKITTSEQLDIWLEGLKDIDYKLAQKAVHKIMLESEYAPTIATIRRQALEITTPKLSVSDGVENIFNTIRTYGVHQGLKALKSLEMKDEVAYKVVKAIGYRNLCMANPNFSRDLVAKMYKESATSLEKQRLLPTVFRKEIAQIQSNGLMMLEGE